MMRALITAEVHPYIRSRLEELGYAVDVLPEISKSELLEVISAYNILIITTYTVIDSDVIDKADSLKIIGRVGSGMENVDTAYCSLKNILCINSPEGNANAVGEHCLAMLLSLLNKINKSNNELRERIFLREDNRGEELDGKIVGIIGFGNTGSAFARKLKGFDAEIFVYDKYKTVSAEGIKNASIREIQDQCDIISFHVPYSQETHHYCDAMFLSQCAKSPVIINTSRGAVLNTPEILTTLESGKLKGLCIDVYEDEPLNKGKVHSEEVYSKLLSYQNVVATPHVAGWTVQSKYKLAKILMDKIELSLPEHPL